MRRLLDCSLMKYKMAARNDDVAKADDIQKKWLLVKETWLKDTKRFSHCSLSDIGGGCSFSTLLLPRSSSIAIAGSYPKTKYAKSHKETT